jgi:DNA-binding GntR family transcriptional regulator
VGETLSDKAYRLISKMLLSEKLIPGQKISEQQLAEACGISRTPVHEAIRRLTDEGVLYQLPSSGTYVAKIDRYQLIDFYEVRILIECFAIERAVHNLSKEERQALRDHCDAIHAIILQLREKSQQILDGKLLVDFLFADLSFHMVLLKAAGNRFALKIVNTAYQRNLVFGHHSHRRDLRHLAWAWMHHAKIERAIRRGDIPGAQRWMRTHIARSMQEAVSSFDRAAVSETDTWGDSVDSALDQLASRFD